jgi:hypothetical protein
MVAPFRADYARYLGDAFFQEVIEDLKQVSPQFCLWWERQEARGFPEETRSLHHPALGRLEFEQVTFQMPITPDLHVKVYAGSPYPPERKPVDVGTSTNRMLSDADQHDGLGTTGYQNPPEPALGLGEAHTKLGPRPLPHDTAPTGNALLVLKIGHGILGELSETPVRSQVRFEILGTVGQDILSSRSYILLANEIVNVQQILDGLHIDGIVTASVGLICWTVGIRRRLKKAIEDSRIGGTQTQKRPCAVPHDTAPIGNALVVLKRGDVRFGGCVEVTIRSQTPANKDVVESPLDDRYPVVIIPF